MLRPWARPTPLSLTLISPASLHRVLLCMLFRLDVQRLDPHGRDDLRRAPGEDAADRHEAEGLGAERGRAVQGGDHDREEDDLDQVGGHRGHHHGLWAFPRGPADHQHADAEEHGDDGHPDQRAYQSLDPDQGGAHGHHDRGRDRGQRSRAPNDRGVLRQHYEAPEGSTAILLAPGDDPPRPPRGGKTRNNVPRAAQEPVAAPLPRCGYPVRFTKGTTGLSIAVEGLLVKHITKSLTLSLPDRTQFMTNTGRQASPGPSSRPGSAICAQF